MSVQRGAWAVGAALAVAGLLASGCSSSSGSKAAVETNAVFQPVPSGQQVDITLESYIMSEGAGPAAVLTGLVKNFEQLHPNIQVKVQAPSGGLLSATGIVGSLQREEAAGSPPDLEQGTFDALSYLASGLGAVNLTDRIGTAAIQANYGGDHPYDTAVTKLGVVNGSVYGIPWTLSTPILFYNPTLFAKAGLDPSKPPTTWAQVGTDAAAIHRVTGADGMANGCVGAGAIGSDWCLQSIVDSDGGQVIDPANGKVALNSPGNISALSALQQIDKAGGLANLTEPQEIEEFGSGKLGMLLQTSALQSLLLKSVGTSFSVDAAAMPAFASHLAKPTNSGSALFILSKDPMKQRAAWELIEYLTGDAAETAIAEGIGYPPLRTTLIDDAKYLKSWSDAQALIAPNIAQLAHVTPWMSYPGPNFSQIETLFANSAAKVVFEGADATATLGSAQSQGQQLAGVS